ncbi:MAG: HDIG domain-containing protein [Candidatus Aminicenantes bacterium]|nr:HDIG domain-containing protein [Candidatus Aminicenantes bacterium]
MNPISFKNLKFFKKSEPQTPKQKNSSSPSTTDIKLSFWKKLAQSPIVILFIFVVILAVFISYVPSRSLPLPIEGEIARSDIIAPANLNIEDKETTEKRRKEAADAILPVYLLNANVFSDTEENIREFFNYGREWLKEPVTVERRDDFQKNIQKKYDFEISSKNLRLLIKTKFAAVTEESLISLLGKISARGIILSKNLFIHGEQKRGFNLLMGPDTERVFRVEEIIDTKEAKEILAEEIDQLDLHRNEKALLKDLANFVLLANINYNKTETEARKEQARRSVRAIFYTIKKGKVIIRKGDEVDREALEQINMINQNLQAKPGWLSNFSGTFLLYTLLFLALWYYLNSITKFRRALKIFIMMGATLIISVLLYKLSIFLANIFSASTNIFLFRHTQSYWYAFLFQFGVLLFAFLAGNQLAMIYTILNSLLVGYLFKENFYLMIFSLIGGLVAIYGIKYFGRQKRTSAFRAGIFLVAPTNIIVILIIHLIREIMGPVDVLVSELFMGILGGILSGSLAFLLLQVFENVFDFLTQTKLLELMNTDLPIFRQMATEAPGTYQHSLTVASLAERAAEEIKLDPMLVKASALYHDIGKIRRPEYFIENRIANPDMHRDLKPSMSTLVIINHVKEGVELAKKLKLPEKIIEIIAQHHGRSLMRFFFQKAKEKYDPEMHKIGEESYRYAGPIPKSKEAALIMLSDSVEAAARSLKTPSLPSLRKVITDIFNNYIQDGQLDDCYFSFKELQTVASTFLSTLYSIYHPRVEYPGFDFEMKKKTEKNKKPDDRNYKSTA